MPLWLKFNKKVWLREPSQKGLCRFISQRVWETLTRSSKNHNRTCCAGGLKCTCHSPGLAIIASATKAPLQEVSGDFEEYPFQTVFAFALCKVLILCHLHRPSLCSEAYSHHINLSVFSGNCSQPREELKMFWNVPWYKNTGMQTAQQKDPDSTKFQWGPEKLRGQTGMTQPLKMFGRLIWAPLWIFIYKAWECEQCWDFSARLNEETRFQGDHVVQAVLRLIYSMTSQITQCIRLIQQLREPRRRPKKLLWTFGTKHTSHKQMCRHCRQSCMRRL